MQITPGIPFEAFVAGLTWLRRTYDNVPAREIDWELVMADMRAETFPRAGTLYLKEEQDGVVSS